MIVDENYMKEHYKGMSPKEAREVMKVMQKYGDNHWWESDDPMEIAKHQIFEDVLLTNFKTYHQGLATLIGRSIEVGELSSKKYTEKLRKEAKDAIERGSKGGLTSKLSLIMVFFGFLVSIFFLSSNFTGNIIGNLSNSGSNYLGIVSLVIGLVGVYLWKKKQKTR
ncbi:MAG: hypothetical protein KKF48_00490 [Nanoarchaeota archaeon]|nr:hypothetical protein [Nanoarchaeota archaeon]MBU1027503.1 hypothetical protein [Nanoarchaeota archaeon]